MSLEPDSQIVFGETVDGLKPGQIETMTAAKTFGWPVQTLTALKPGDYTVQVVLNCYETFHRADGSVTKLAPNRGEGQHWNLATDAEFTYGEWAEHCWNGDPKLPNAYSRLHYNMQYLPKILDRIEKTAPAGADVTSWRY